MHTNTYGENSSIKNNYSTSNHFVHKITCMLDQQHCTLPEIVIALQTFYYMLRKQKFTRLNTVIMATVMATSGYPADKDSVHMYFRLTNFTQVPYRNFLSVLQCISNQQSIQIKALVKYSHHSSTWPETIPLIIRQC